jgi:hypothetical protein
LARPLRVNGGRSLAFARSGFLAEAARRMLRERAEL